jgi:SAM-dependent methyltransferase
MVLRAYMKNLLLQFKRPLLNFLVTYHKELERKVGNANSLLDVGCGSDSPIKYFKKRIGFTLGVDGFEPSIKESRQKRIHDEYRCMNLLEIEQEFGANSFDCVLSSDVIEHFTKKNGIELIYQMESIARNRVIIFTPNGFVPQYEHSGNLLQRHQSGWTSEEMLNLGYDVIGINGWKPLLNEGALTKYRPHLFWIIISRFTQFLVRNLPKHAFQILCVKTF